VTPAVVSVPGVPAVGNKATFVGQNYKDLARGTPSHEESLLRRVVAAPECRMLEGGALLTWLLCRAADHRPSASTSVLPVNLSRQRPNHASVCHLIAGDSACTETAEVNHYPAKFIQFLTYEIAITNQSPKAQAYIHRNRSILGVDKHNCVFGWR
jgi:hypothetical protein